jgi:hypothetical protein
MAQGSLRSAMVASVVGIALVLPWVLTLLSLVGFPLAAHILITLATAALTAYSLRRLEPVSRSSTTARTSP